MTHIENTEKYLRALQAKGIFKTDVAVFDLETTGLDVNEDRIIEICICKLYTNGKFESFVTLVNPGVEISAKISELTGITNELVDDAPTFEEVSDSVLNLLSDTELITYNGSKFDKLLIIAELTRCNKFWDFTKCKDHDVYQIYKNTLPYKLTMVYKSLTGQELQNAHTASADVYATTRVLHEIHESHPYLKDQEEERGTRILDGSKMFQMVDGKVYLTKGKHKSERASEHKDYLTWILGDQGFAADTKLIANLIIIGSLS